MQINSSLSGYGYNGRIREMETVAPKPTSQEEQQSGRGPGTPTVSSTVLSSSLANMLWAVGGAQAPVDGDAVAPVSTVDKAEAQVQWVKSAYTEYDVE
jgi:hypothetical protein